MTPTGEKSGALKPLKVLLWMAAAALSGLATGVALSLAAIVVYPNEKPQALLKQDRMRSRVGETVVLDASPSKVLNRPEARLRIDWMDASDRLLLPAGVDPEGANARVLTVYGTSPGEREIVLRVTNTSRCHRLAKFALPPRYCEASDEVRARVDFRPECKSGAGLPVDELVLDSARVIGANELNTECRLVLPKLIVTNGHRLEIREEVPLETAPGGSRIIAFRAPAPNGAAGAAGTDGPRASEGQPGTDGGAGTAGQIGPNGRDAAPVVIVSSALSGQLAIENTGQAGGRGGIGGRGGQGGRGGNTLMASVSNCDRLIEAQPGGKGGASGPGGNGGRGGNAAPVQIEFARPVVSPSKLTVSADGGAGGAGGPPGYPGRGGKGGFGVTRAACPPAADGPDAVAGQPNASGSAGQAGSAAALAVRDGSRDRSQSAGSGTAVSLPTP
jgi:hypothetical protein